MVGAPPDGTYLSGGGHVSTAFHAFHTVFRDYYQIGADGESDDAAPEPLKKKELTGRMEGPHSLFGIIWQVATATGWTVEYIMRRVPYNLLMLMLQDAPRYISGKQAKRKGSAKGKQALDFFQTTLKKE